MTISKHDIIMKVKSECESLKINFIKKKSLYYDAVFEEIRTRFIKRKLTKKEKIERHDANIIYDENSEQLYIQFRLSDYLGMLKEFKNNY